VNQRFPNGGIVLHGLSMGGGIILDLACRDMKNVRAMICDAPSYNIDAFLADVARGVFKKDHAKVYACLAARFLNEFGVPSVVFDRVENIKKGKYPLLLSAGSNEGQEEVLRRIQENNPMDTEIVILPGCNHGNGMYKQTELYQTAITNFLKRYVNLP
jgi:pimeloyl-ACP methyl ester carboxylesterase